MRTHSLESRSFSRCHHKTPQQSHHISSLKKNDASTAGHALQLKGMRFQLVPEKKCAPRLVHSKRRPQTYLIERPDSDGNFDRLAIGHVDERRLPNSLNSHICHLQAKTRITEQNRKWSSMPLAGVDAARVNSSASHLHQHFKACADGLPQTICRVTAPEAPLQERRKRAEQMLCFV
jgi:hypothetical protein